MFVYYINVPLNYEGVEEFEAYDEEMKNVKTYELSENEYRVLRKKRGLFDLFDEKLGTIMDVCEEERSSLNQIPESIIIVQDYMKKVKNQAEIDICNTVLEALQTALKAGTFCEIDIYLE